MWPPTTSASTSLGDKRVVADRPVSKSARRELVPCPARSQRSSKGGVSERVKTKRTALPDPRKLGCAHEVRPGKPGVCVWGGGMRREGEA
jgi:hypothetical protein